MIQHYIKCIFFAIIVVLLQFSIEKVAVLVLTNLYVDSQTTQCIGLFLGLLGAILFLLFFQKEYIISCLKLLKVNKTTAALFLFFFLLVAVSFAGMSVISAEVGILSHNNETVDINFYHLIIYSLLIGLNEEFIFRGLILGFIRRKAGNASAIVLSSLLFLCVHPYYSGIAPFITAFIVACIFAFLTIKYKSLVPSIGLHAGWDFSFMVVEKYYVTDSVVPVWGDLFEIPQIIFLSIIALSLYLYEKKIGSTQQV